MKENEMQSSLFLHEESDFEYEEEKRKNKQRIVRNEFVKIGKYGIPLIRK